MTKFSHDRMHASLSKHIVSQGMLVHELIKTYKRCSLAFQERPSSKATVAGAASLGGPQVIFRNTCASLSTGPDSVGNLRVAAGIDGCIDVALAHCEDNKKSLLGKVANDKKL